MHAFIFAVLVASSHVCDGKGGRSLLGLCLRSHEYPAGVRAMSVGRFAPLLVSAAAVALPVGSQLLFAPGMAVPATQALIRPRSFVADAVKRSGPAVVTLETQRTVQTGGIPGVPRGLLMDPFFRRFFGFQGSVMPRSRVETGQGSGVIYEASGLVLTNAHVVEKADKVIVGLPDGRRVSGRVLGQDSLTDLAVVRLDQKGPWPTAPLGNSDALQVGDWAIAVGNPFGLENTVTLGIVSNLNRNVSQLGISGKRLDLIQTDAAINPGNSGGALVNMRGELVGINTAIFTRSGGSNGIGFAIPASIATTIMKELIDHGQVVRGWIGVETQPLTSELARSFGVNKTAGVLISGVYRKGPAAAANIFPGDILTHMNGQKVADGRAAMNQVADLEPGTEVSVSLLRDGQSLDRSIRVIQRPSSAAN